MDMTIRPMTPQERLYSYSQSQQITMQTGTIGYLRGDFDSSGNEFHSTWFDEVESRKSDEFKAEFQEVIDALRFDEQYGGLLASRSAMQKCGRSQPESAFEGNYTTEYGFRIDTKQFAYLLRCIPVKGDYNFYCWCFEAKWLDRHIKQAEKVSASSPRTIRNYFASRTAIKSALPSPTEPILTAPAGILTNTTWRWAAAFITSVNLLS